MFIVLLFSVASKEINRILTVEFRLLNHTLIDINIFMPLYMTLCACVHVVSQLRGMLFQTAGALRRVWAAVWFVACTTGGRVRDTALPRLGPSLSHYLRGSAHAETHTHTHTDVFSRQQMRLCAPLATATTTAAAASGARVKLGMWGKVS